MEIEILGQTTYLIPPPPPRSDSQELNSWALAHYLPQISQGIRSPWAVGSTRRAIDSENRIKR